MTKCKQILNQEAEWQAMTFPTGFPDNQKVGGELYIHNPLL